MGKSVKAHFIQGEQHKSLFSLRKLSSRLSLRLHLHILKRK